MITPTCWDRIDWWLYRREWCCVRVEKIESGKERVWETKVTLRNKNEQVTRTKN